MMKLMITEYLEKNQLKIKVMHNCYERYLELKSIIQRLEKEKRQMGKKHLIKV